MSDSLSISERQPCLPRQVVVILLALVLWAIWPVARIEALLVAYLVALVVVNAAVRWKLPWWPAGLGWLPSIGLVLLIGVVPAKVLVQNWAEIWDEAGLRNIETPLADRLRLEAVPAIAPPIVRTDQPQRFYIHAPAGSTVGWRIDPDRDPIAALELGHGLYRVDYDPRRDGLPKVHSGGFQAELLVDGKPTRRSMQAIDPQPHPRWFSSSPEFGVAATVSEETDELILIRRNAESARIQVGDGPTDCVLFDKGRKVAVIHRWTPELWIVDVEQRNVERRIATRSRQVRLALGAEQRTLAIAVAGRKAGVQLLQLADLSLGPFIPLDAPPDWICFGPSEAMLVVASRQDRAIRRVLDRRRLPAENPSVFPEPFGAGAEPTSGWTVDPTVLRLTRPVITLCRGPRGKSIYAAVSAYGEDAEVANHLIRDTILRVDTGSWQIADSFGTERRTAQQNFPGNIDAGASPLGMAVLDDDTLAVVFGGSDDLAYYPIEASGKSSHYSLGELGVPRPHGLADLGEGKLCVSSPSQSALSVFAIETGDHKLVALTGDDAQLAVSNPLALAQRRGEQSFYEATRAGIACQSCHTHADSDYAIQNIGQGFAAATLSVRGVSGTAPYLRDASYPRLAGLHRVSLELFRGYRRDVPYDRAAAIAAYLDSLPPLYNPRPPDEEDLAQLRAGVDALVKARCVLCHAFPALTNLSQHAEEVLFPRAAAQRSAPDKLDTPSLVGLSVSAPYLHDGRAASVRAVLIDQNPERRHGAVDLLSEEELAALVYFLESL